MKPESNDIDRIINSDEAAFCRFMERYSSRLYHYVFALIGQKEPAEEVVSDVFYEVWKNRKTFIFAPIQSPDEAMISKEEMEKINNAIQQLPPKCKHVFFLAKIEGLPYKEIADILNISVKTINNHIAFALEEIAKNLNLVLRKK